MAKTAKDNLYRGPWTKTNLRDLKTFFPHKSTRDVSYILNRPELAVKKKASRLGLKKSKKYLKSIGRA